ncbi:MAG: ATP-binding protein [Rhodocyclaceae bacterium]|nr:ATP-binding protein [Rhodocyclaceae bacterium]
MRKILGEVFGSLRGRLILGVVLLQTAVMSLFVWDLTTRQQALLLERQGEHALALAGSIATSAAGWLAARDYYGVQEILHAQASYPDVLYAMVVDRDGLIVAHTERARLGQYLLDLPPPEAAAQGSQFLNRTSAAVDVLHPVKLAGRHIGWVRLALGQATTAKRLAEISRDGVLYIAAAVFLGGLLSGLFITHLTRRLQAMREAADAIEAGDRQRRVEVVGNDEAARLGHAMNAMLDTLVEREDALRASEARLAQHRDELEREVQHRTAELEKTRDAAEAASRAKSMFLANMSHELRTPLNAILGFAQLMERDPRLPEDLRAKLATINRSGNYLLSLINDVLEISRIEAGRLTANIAPLNLHELLASLVEVMTVRARSKGLELKLERAADLPEGIASDAAKLRQILLNLLSNAVKFTPAGEVVLTARLLERKGDDIVLEFAVRDTGVGMKAEELERIFTPFFQAEAGLRQIEGTGLGLAISRQYARLMGGEIYAESVPGAGSTFRLRLPATLAAAPVAAPQQGRVRALAAGEPRYRILVAEDEPVNQELVRLLLEEVGFEVAAAADGREAVELFQRWRPHLVLMDMRMPIMDGFAATREIRALPSGEAVPIIAFTASAFEEERRAILAAGCTDVMTKPLEENRFFELIERHLGARFEREAPTAPTPPTAAEPDYAVLPAPTLAALSEAAARLDAEAVREIAQQLSFTHPEHARHILDLAAGYRFERIEALASLARKRVVG